MNAFIFPSQFPHIFRTQAANKTEEEIFIQHIE